MNDDKRPRHRWAASVVRLIGLWILAGAAFKLLWGTPNDLPPVVRDVPLELGLTYRLAIGIELCVAFLAFLRPRWAWPLTACVLLVFDAVLLTQLGAENCGCFGSKISVPPWLMLAIDSALLVALLVTRPWSALARGGPNVVMLAGACALGLALPWVLDRQSLPSSIESNDPSQDEPRLGRSWVQLDVESWVGKDVWDTPLARWIDVTSLPLSGLWVLYRNTCDHCAAHLEHLADTEKGERFLTLVRLEEPADTEANRVVMRLPEGDFVQRASLPPTQDYVLTTPGELLLEDGRIVGAREGAKPPDGF